MNVSNNEEQVVAKKLGGLNPILIIPILIAIGVAIYLFVLGSPGNFKADPRLNGLSSVAFSDLETKELHPDGFLGIIYMGGPIVPILISFMIIVIVFAIERALVLSKAAGKGNVDNFVLNVRRLLNQNKIDEAIVECDNQQGSVGNVVKEGLTTYKALSHDNSMNKEQKMVALNKSIEEATTLELPYLQQNLSVIATISTLGTLMGLFGTVLGMIRSFGAMGQEGAPDSTALAVGISEALYNTAMGIGTGAASIISYSYFSGKVEDITNAVDEVGFAIGQTYTTLHGGLSK